MEAVWLTSSVAGSGFNDCGTCGASVQWRKQSQHENFHKTFSHRKEQDMSKVAWCDPGNHAFKAGSPGSASFSGDQVGENGSVETVTQDMCAEHNPYAPSNLKEQAQLLRLTSEAESDLKQ